MNKKSIFLAAPISGFADENEYKQYREKVLLLIKFLRNNSFNVYSEVERVIGIDNYDSPEQSAKGDFAKISNADIFILLHPCKVQTSALIELGYALAISKKIIIISPKTALPYLALGLPSISSSVNIINSLDLTTYTFEKILLAINNIYP